MAEAMRRVLEAIKHDCEATSCSLYNSRGLLMSTGKIVEGDVSARMTRLALAVEGLLQERGLGGLKRLVVEGDSLSTLVVKVGTGVEGAFLCLVLPRDASVGLAQLVQDAAMVDVRRLLKSFDRDDHPSGGQYRGG